MFESFILGAGSKILVNVINSMFSLSEKKSERKYLNNKELLEGHIELAKINSKNLIMQWTQSICTVMIFATLAFICVWAMIYPDQTDVLVPIKHGLISRLFNQPESVAIQGSTPGVLFQYVFEIVVMVAGAFCIPTRK
jgi:hypothetical protein